ncbi:MAG: nucleoside-diphosphate-sugar epimerase [Planctomycetota bacterium]
MHVLITGGAGYLGSVLTRHLLNEHHEVRVLDCLLHGPQDHLSELEDVDEFEFIQGDIRDTETVAHALNGIDAVVHLAGIVGDPACAREPDLAQEVNYDASIRLHDAAIAAGVKRFLFASTCSNYGRMMDASGYVTESSELRPVSLYARSKVEFEQHLLAKCEHGIPPAAVPILLRFATLFGMSPRMRFDLTVNEFTRDLVRDRHLVVYGEQFWRPYVHVFDAARAILMALSSSAEEVAGQVFNVGDTTENYKKGQLVTMICEAVGGDLEIERVTKNEDPRDYRVSFDRIKTVLGFEITKTVPDGIHEVMNSVSESAELAS